MRQAKAPLVLKCQPKGAVEQRSWQWKSNLLREMIDSSDLIVKMIDSSKK